MGKKRRILTRTTKFAKKYFEFLDKVDGASNVIDAAEVDDVIERGEDFVDTIVVTDLGNQTVKVEGRVIAFAAGEKVELSFDGGAFGTATVIDANAGVGLDKMQYSINPFNNGSFLSTGVHTFSVRKENEANKALHSEEVSFEVAAAKIEMTANAGFATAVLATGDVNLDLREITYGARRRPGETTDYQVGAQGGAFTGGSYVMSATKQVGDTLEAAQAAAAVAVGLEAGVAAQNDDHNIANDHAGAISDADLPEAGQFVVYKFTLTPCLADNTTEMTNSSMVATLEFQRNA